MPSTPLSRSSSLSNPRLRSSPRPANNAKRQPFTMIGDEWQAAPRTAGSPPDIPAPVASLLASTAIPMPRKRGQQGGRRRSTLQGKARVEGDNVSELEKNCLDILLAAPEEEKSSSVSVEPSLPVSVPSLDHDDDASITSSSRSSRESMLARPPLELKRKLVCDPEACELDHPLQSDGESHAYSSESESESEYDLSATAAVTARLRDFSTFSPFPKLKAKFKSNLTTSIRTLKAAAQTVSNFATPSVWVDNNNDSQPIFHITPELTDDKRPILCNETPSPALRRYLNPHSTYDQLIYSYYESSRGRQKPLVCVSSIQMQTYSPASSSAARARLASESIIPDTTGDDEPLPSRPNNPRHHREPRENSDFLRVLVLEQGMRRQGKLPPKQPGKARVWLPPRLPEVSARLCPADAPAVVSTTTAGGGGEGRSTRSLSSPQRWVGLTLD